MTAQDLKNPWLQMIALSMVIMIIIFVYKIAVHRPELQYLQLLVTYEFGFAKRALIGTLLSFAFPIVAVSMVYVLGITIWVVAFLLFVWTFKKIFGFARDTLPLFAFLFGSPFLLKNFAFAIGYFDIYGFILALICLLLPARSFLYVVAACLGCVALLFIHHIHLLMYIPTIGVIVAMRHFALQPITPLKSAGTVAMIGVIGAAGLFLQFYGRVGVPMPELLTFVRSRMADPTFAIDPGSFVMWYGTLDGEIARTRMHLWSNSLRLPIFAAVVAVHWPVIRYFVALIGVLDSARWRRLSVLAIIFVTCCHAVIFYIAFDYSRWVASWAVSLILILHAVKLLPARAPVAMPVDDRSNRWFGWITTAIPRLGITKPF